MNALIDHHADQLIGLWLERVRELCVKKELTAADVEKACAQVEDQLRSMPPAHLLAWAKRLNQVH